jgi:glycosyltransferase involved in cell wall biosynthesis
VKGLKRVFSSARHIVVVSRWQQRRMYELGCPEEKLHVIPCGAPLGQMPERRQPNAVCTFVVVARLVPVKGVDVTLKAFIAAQRKGADARLVVVGDGPMRKYLEKLASRATKGTVEFMGTLSNGQTRALLSLSDVYCQHSVTTRHGQVEGWPVALAEAAAAGLPAIGSRHGGIVDQIVDGVTGFLVKEGDWEGMAEKMIALATNGDLRLEMGRRARANIEIIGDCQKQINALAGVLKQATCSQ